MDPINLDKYVTNKPMISLLYKSVGTYIIHCGHGIYIGNIINNGQGRGQAIFDKKLNNS